MLRSGLMLLLLATAIPAHAEWGRLFYTPQQRAELDQGGAPGTPGASAATEPQWQHFNGMAQREGGHPLRWINGQLDQQVPPATVKPGESWNPSRKQTYSAGRKP